MGLPSELDAKDGKTRPKNYHGDSERQLLYTICSRAMHDLTIVSVGQASQLFADVPSHEYELTDRLS